MCVCVYIYICVCVVTIDVIFLQLQSYVGKHFTPASTVVVGVGKAQSKRVAQKKKSNTKLMMDPLPGVVELYMTALQG